MKGAIKNFLVSMFILIIGLVFLLPSLLFGQTMTLACERVRGGQVDCVIQAHWFGVVMLGEWPVRDVRRAQMTSSWSKDEDGNVDELYNVALDSADGQINLFTGFSGEQARKRYLVEEINAFLEDSTQLTFRQFESEWLALVITAPFAIIGLVLIYIAVMAFWETLKPSSPSSATNQKSKDLTSEKRLETPVPHFGRQPSSMMSKIMLVVWLALGILAGGSAMNSQVVGQCTIKSHSVSRSRPSLFNFYSEKIESIIYISLRTNDRRIVSTKQVRPHATRAEADVYRGQYSNGATYPCWYDAWLPESLSLQPGSSQTYSFWLLLALAILLIGNTVINLLYYRYNEGDLTRGNRLPVRVQPDLGQPKPFLLGCGLPGLLVLSALILTLFMAARLRFAEWDESFWLAAVPLLLVSLITAIILYMVLKNLYLLYKGSETIVELSNYPLKSGDSALLYISHQAGRMALQRLIVRVICKETTRTKVRSSSDSGSRYRYDTQTLDDMILHTEEEHTWSTVKFWEQTLDLSLPDSAKATTAKGHYPQIIWSIHVELVIAKSPDITLRYALEVIE